MSHRSVPTLGAGAGVLPHKPGNIFNTLAEEGLTPAHSPIGKQSTTVNAESLLDFHKSDEIRSFVHTCVRDDCFRDPYPGNWCYSH
jgi:hypothetical protein